MQNFAFIKCSAAGAVSFKTKKGNRLHMFDSIGFLAKDINEKSFEIEGLNFDQEKGWYDASAVNPKYYGKEVYAACIDYAADKAISDSLVLQLAFFGKAKPIKCILLLSYSEIVRQLENRGYTVCPMDEQQGQAVLKKEEVA